MDAVFCDYDDTPPRAPQVNDFRLLEDGTLWIRAGDFQPDAAGMAALQTMLAALARLPSPRRIVFDARGNLGGNSGFGEAIFQAATGGLVFEEDGLERLPRTQAFWRVSGLGIVALEARTSEFRARLGPDDALVRSQEAFILQLRVALARGERWLEQGVGQPMLDAGELVRRHAHLARFAGPVALVTDDRCASACLDFADRVRSVPGSLHLGETTEFDSVYLDIGWITLPSGNALTLPLKVWRNRPRGNDQPWVPQVPLKVTGVDDTTVRAEVLDALRPSALRR